MIYKQRFSRWPAFCRPLQKAAEPQCNPPHTCFSYVFIYIFASFEGSAQLHAGFFFFTGCPGQIGISSSAFLLLGRARASEPST
jgi:hypothetical protein